MTLSALGLAVSFTIMCGVLSGFKSLRMHRYDEAGEDAGSKAEEMMSTASSLDAAD